MGPRMGIFRRIAPVAQMDRALACGAKGQRFESSRAREGRPNLWAGALRGIRTERAVAKRRAPGWRESEEGCPAAEATMAEARRANPLGRAHKSDLKVRPGLLNQSTAIRGNAPSAAGDIPVPPSPPGPGPSSRGPRSEGFEPNERSQSDERQDGARARKAARLPRPRWPRHEGRILSGAPTNLI